MSIHGNASVGSERNCQSPRSESWTRKRAKPPIARDSAGTSSGGPFGTAPGSRRAIIEARFGRFDDLDSDSPLWPHTGPLHVEERDAARLIEYHDLYDESSIERDPSERYTVLRMSRYDFLAIDFETANRSRSSLCCIGVAAVADGVVVQSGSWLVNPLDDFDVYNTNVHGIDEDAVADAPTLAEIWPHLHETIDGEHLVAHNASFDLSVLRSSAAAQGIPDGPSFDLLCTWRLAKVVRPHLPSHGLDFLARSFNLSLDHHDAHSDARVCAQLALRLCADHGATDLGGLAQSLGFRPATFTSDSYRAVDYRKVTSLDGDRDADPDHPFYGKAICFTGTLASMERRLARELVAAVGGHFKTNLSRQVDYLVLGDADFVAFADGWTTDKLDRALALRSDGHNVEIISERQYLELLGDA